MIVHFHFRRKLDIIHARRNILFNNIAENSTGFNPQDINWFRMNMRKFIQMIKVNFDSTIENP